jgi:maleylpyruvate isomerase
MREPVLYGYWRSSAAYRVRIVLNLKQIAAEQVFVHLVRGEQRDETYLAENPAGLVPCWREPDGFHLAQSLAIIDYLESLYPDPPLLPSDARLKAICREIAYTIACDIHPLGNLRVLDKLTADFGADSDNRQAWMHHWIAAGFSAIETRLKETAGRHAIGDQISLADVCLVPQVYNARRLKLDLTPYPSVVAAEAAASILPAFMAAAPERQPDAA